MKTIIVISIVMIIISSNHHYYYRLPLSILINDIFIINHYFCHVSLPLLIIFLAFIPTSFRRTWPFNLFISYRLCVSKISRKWKYNRSQRRLVVELTTPCDFMASAHVCLYPHGSKAAKYCGIISIYYSKNITDSSFVYNQLRSSMIPQWTNSLFVS